MREGEQRSRRLCVFQMHHPEAEEKLLETSAVPRVVASGLFDHVVLAVADVGENDVLDRYAARWGVEVFRGAERDVARRIRDCARAFECDVIARALVWWFFLDLDLVAGQLATLEGTDADWVHLPTSCDMRFGMDVFRPSFLDEVLEAFAADDEARRTYQLNPWGFAEARPERFRVLTHEPVPVLDRAAFDALRGRMRALWPDRWDGVGLPLFPYRRAAEFLADGGGEALDVACGLGAGTALLARSGRVLGVDTDPAAVETCRGRTGEGAHFVVGDAMELDLGAARFDVVCTAHTMEHIADDRGFLARLAHWMKPGGRLVLEVPFRARYPFRDVEEPLSPDHVREYDAASLLALVGERFVVDEAYGVNRGAYLPLDRARSAGLVVGTVRKGA